MFELSMLFRLDGENLIVSDAGKFLLIVIAGAFGGLLYSIQNRKLNLPSYNSKTKEIELGVIADCLMGVGGALVVFLIVPGGATQLQLLELCATSIIGGYGGRSLIDQALDGMLRQQVQENTKKIEADKKQAERDADTLKYLSIYLDKSLDLAPNYEETLLKNIKHTSLTIRRWVFDKTQLEFYNIRQKEKLETLDKKLVDNARKIFESLRDADEAKINDRYPAHVAYTLMEVKEWNEAIKQLDEAKKRLKSPKNEGGDKRKNEIVYEVNQAVCQLNINQEDEEKKKKIIDALFQKINEYNLPTENKDNLWEIIRNSVPAKYLKDVPQIEKLIDNKQTSIN
jgi:hypothetical protein